MSELIAPDEGHILKEPHPHSTNINNYDPQRHVLPVASDDISEGDLVGIWCLFTTDRYGCVCKLDTLDDLWVIDHVGIAMNSAKKNDLVKVSPMRGLSLQKIRLIWLWDRE